MKTQLVWLMDRATGGKRWVKIPARNSNAARSEAARLFPGEMVLGAYVDEESASDAMKGPGAADEIPKISAAAGSPATTSTGWDPSTTSGPPPQTTPPPPADTGDSDPNAQNFSGTGWDPATKDSWTGPGGPGYMPYTGGEEEATGMGVAGDFYQTNLSRRQALEEGDPSGFAAFLEELQKAGLGSLQGVGRKFMEDQYFPLYHAYQAEQVLPLAGDIPFGSDLSGLDEDQRQRLQDALRRKQQKDYEGIADPDAQRALDQEVITEYSPTFGDYVSGALPAGGRQARQRIGQQLQALSQRKVGGVGAKPGSFNAQFLAPSTSDDAKFITNLASQALQGRYSPIALRALQNYLPTEGKLWADYLRQSTPLEGTAIGVGSDFTPPNFAQFVGQQYGLY